MLNGTLDDFTLPDVLRLIAGARRTGGLAVARDGGAGTLFFRDGTVSGAAPRYDRRTEAGSPERAVEDLAFDLMRWERGEFTWTPGRPASTPGPEAVLDVDELLRAVARRLEELAQIHTLVPSEETVLTMAPQPPEGAAQINITPAEWRVLVLVDGHRTVTEIAEAAHLDDLDAMKLLYGLAAAGLVSAGHGAAPAPMEERYGTEVPAVREPEAPAPVEKAAPAFEEPKSQPEPEPAALVEEEPEPEAQPELEPAALAEEHDPFLSELTMAPVSSFEAIPPAPAEAHEAAAVDRSTAARELAGLFDDADDVPALGGMTFAAPPAPPGGSPRAPRRVEDDDQVTRGLISRLIDGVKGL